VGTSEEDAGGGTAVMDTTLRPRVSRAAFRGA
jgi:hypothetical protein